MLVHRDNIAAKRIKLDFTPTTFEFVLSSMKLLKGTVIIFAIYRTGPVTNEFFNELTAVFEVIVPYSFPVVITGDLNIHLDIHSDCNAARLIELLVTFGFVQSVVLAQPTDMAELLMSSSPGDVDSRWAA